MFQFRVGNLGLDALFHLADVFIPVFNVVLQDHEVFPLMLQVFRVVVCLALQPVSFTLI